MSRKTTEKLTGIEVAYIIVAFAVVIASLSYVILTNYDHTPSTLNVSFNNLDSVYDVSVINIADVDDFIEVKGIGEVKANEIVAYRDAISGFDDVYQLLDVKSVTAELFESIITHFYLDESQTADDLTSDKDADTSEKADEISDESVSLPKEEDNSSSENDSLSRRSVNINTASADEIAACLLISTEQAKQIVEVREIIGGYSNISELVLCSLLQADLYTEIKPYIIL